jgi:hypothetical protein
MAGHQSHSLHVGKYEPSQKAKTMAYAFIAIGVLVFILGLIKNPDRIWQSYLTSYFFFTCLALGGLFFAAINHIARAGWSVPVRRIAESFTSFIPVILIGALLLVAGVKHLYPWADAERMATDALLASKKAYLNLPFTIVRWVIFGGLMIYFAKSMVGGSLAQDKDGSETHTHKNLGHAVRFAVVFALGFSLFSVDLLMALSPYWYSTIFGIYTFAGLFQSTMAAIVLAMIYLRRQGLVKGYLTDEHMHDVAKYMKGFTVFWAYIAFSQFMLIWYANIPEETEFYILRAHGGWMAVSFGLLIFRFIVPFLALLPRGMKRNHNHLILVSVLILIMQYVDIYWLVYPNFNDNHVVFNIWEVGIFLLFAGIFMLGVQKFWSQNSLVPLKDPRLEEAVHHHVSY